MAPSVGGGGGSGGPAVGQHGKKAARLDGMLANLLGTQGSAQIRRTFNLLLTPKSLVRPARRGAQHHSTRSVATRPLAHPLATTSPRTRAMPGARLASPRSGHAACCAVFCALLRGGTRSPACSPRRVYPSPGNPCTVPCRDWRT